MKLLRFGPKGEEEPAVLRADGTVADVSSLVEDWSGPSLEPAGLQELGRRINGLDRLPTVNLASVRVGPPVARVGKVVCVGLNYRAHASESHEASPEEPVLFMKAADTIVGPYDNILIPPGSRKTDYEVELAAVVGRTARYLTPEDDPLSYLVGFTISNDVSEREYQLEHSGQWDKGKNCETFNPLGPWLVTADEVPDPQAVRLELRVNGELRQSAPASGMIFGVGFLVRYISQFMTLYPGDIISTGTPEGVGLGFDPPRYLADGDVLDLSITGLGTQRCTCRRVELAAGGEHLG